MASMNKGRILRFTILIGTLAVSFSCRITPRAPFSEKPVVSNMKMATKFTYIHGFPIVDIPIDKNDHFLILDDSYPRVGLLVNLASATCEPYAVSSTKDYDEKYRNANELSRVDLDKVGLKINVELKGKTDSYKIYSFSEGWTPIPNATRSNALEAFTGEFRVIQYKKGHEIPLIAQNAKNWLPGHIDRRLRFVGNYKYLVYLDEEKEGIVGVYVIEL